MTMKNCYISKESFEKICSQGKQEDMERLIEFQLIEFEKTKKQKGIIKILNEYVEAYNPNIEEEKIEDKLGKKIISFFGDKQDLAKKFIKIQPIYFDDRKLWWIWNQKEYRWVLTDETNILVGIAQNSYANTINGKEKGEILESLRQTSRLSKPKDIKDSWIQFRDKVFDIDNDDEFIATSEYFFTNPIPWEIKETTENLGELSKINQLFETWVGKENVQRLYEVFAFVMVPKYFIHSFFFLYAPPGYGKTTFEKLLIKFIGSYNYTSTSIDRINNNIRFETKNWYKKLLIVMDEVNNIYQLKNSSVINGATGESPVPAEFKGSNKDFKFTNYAKFVYPTNKLLKVDAEDGFGRRVRKIDFVKRFEKEKNVIKEIPDIEFEELAKKSIGIVKKRSEEHTSELQSH